MSVRGSNWKVLYRSRVSTIRLPHTALIGGSIYNLTEIVPTYKNSFGPYKPEGTVYFPIVADVVQREDLDTLRQILNGRQDDIEYCDPQGGTSILHVAATIHSSDLWEVLSSNRIFYYYMDKTDFRGTSPLLAACWHMNINAVAALTRWGADPRLCVSDTRKTVLHVCAEQDTTDILQLIINDSRCNDVLDQTDSDGNTPLMLAVAENSPNATLFINYGANTTAVNPLNGRNIVHMAVVFCNYYILRYCIEEINDFFILNTADVNSDTPLSIAMTLSDSYSMDILLESSYAKQFLPLCQGSLHNLVEENKRYIIEAICSLHPDPQYFDVYDSQGRTPLLYAIELKRVDIIKLLSKINVDFSVRNKYTGDTAFHSAAYTHDSLVVQLVFRCANYDIMAYTEDNQDLTAYEIILGKGSFYIWQLWKGLGKVDDQFENSSEESSLFIAAKEGNYILVLGILLSKKFHKYLEPRKSLDVQELLNLELKRIIYATDIFIILGLDPGERGWKTCPYQEHLFQKNAKGMNIFHACAIGGSLDCLKFMFNFYKRFRDNYVLEMDAGDENGNTPLFYAVHYGWTDVAKYFLKHGCNMSQTNALGWSPLHGMAGQSDFAGVLSEVVNESATTVTTDGYNSEVTISYELLQPGRPKQMQVIWAMFDNLRGPNHFQTLCCPVIEYFVLYKWTKVRHLASIKLFINVLFVFSFTMYLTLKLSYFIHPANDLISVLRWIAIISSILLIVLNIPTLFFRKSHFTLFLLAPLAALTYMRVPGGTRESLELASSALLFSWLSMIMGSHVTKLSYQLAVFQKMLRAIVKLLPLCLLVITAFSLSFFTLFHEYENFNNPLRSFITLSVHMREGNIELPVIPSSVPMEPINSQYKPVFPAEEMHAKTLDEEIELRNLIIEGMLLFMFRVLLVICTFNLLIDAAIKGVTEIEFEVKLQKMKNYVQELAYWELLLDSKLYRLCDHLYITWILGLPINLREKLRIPTKINPLLNPIPDFDISSLKWMVVDHTEQEQDKKFFKYMWEEELANMAANKERPIRRGSKAAANVPWIRRPF